MTLPIKLAAGTAMAFAAACAIPLGAQTGGAPNPEAPIGCTLSVVQSGGMVTVEGVIEARTPVAGTYDLTLRQSGLGGMADVRQGGAFNLAKGESTRLGNASFSGDASGLDGTLTITVNGQSYTCPITS